jgi:hypothetical protein
MAFMDIMSSARCIVYNSCYSENNLLFVRMFGMFIPLGYNYLTTEEKYWGMEKERKRFMTHYDFDHLVTVKDMIIELRPWYENYKREVTVIPLSNSNIRLFLRLFAKYCKIYSGHLLFVKTDNIEFDAQFDRWVRVDLDQPFFCVKSVISFMYLE